MLHAFVLMPEHFHVLLTLARSASLERAVMYIKGGSGRKIGKELSFRFPVWQRGFSDHRIRDKNDYELHRNYIEQNLVKRKIASLAIDYPWSSASGRYQLNDPPQALKRTIMRRLSGMAEAMP